MFVSPTVQYALRALGSMATLPEGESVFARDLAARTSVPASYLSKILNTLGRAGLVEGIRGTRGGYRLTRAPEQISLRAVFEALDPQALDQVCFLNTGNPCSDQEACAIHHHWRRIRRELVAFVDGSTLSDLAPASRAEAGLRTDAEEPDRPSRASDAPARRSRSRIEEAIR